MQKFRTINLDYFSLTMVGLMWFLPFIYYYHWYPLTTFYQEWLCALLGVFAMIPLTTRECWLKSDIPRVVQMPILLIAVVFVQVLLGKMAYPEQGLLYILYLLFAALMMLLGARLRNRIGMEKLAIGLAIFLLLGAEISAVIGLLQHFRIDTPLGALINPKTSSSVAGNLSQPNHLANYIFLGLISLSYLFHQGKVRHISAIFLGITLLFVLALSGSRSSWLYLFFFAALSWWWARRDVANRRLFLLSLFAIAAFVLIHFLLLGANATWGGGGSTNTVARMLDSRPLVSIRVHLWQAAGLMFINSPLFGVGFGQFALNHFQLMPEMQADGISGYFHNAHNLIFQVAAEAGLAGLIVLVVPLVIWLAGLRRLAFTAHYWWASGILGVIAIHSMLELPLWHTFFLSIFALLLGAMDQTSYRMNIGKTGQAGMVLILLFGLTTLIQLRNNYRAIEDVRVIQYSPNLDAEKFKILSAKLLYVHDSLLMTPYAEFYMIINIEVTGERLKEKLAMSTRLMKFLPSGWVTYKHAYLLAQDGQLDLAENVLERAMRSFPKDYGKARWQLVELAKKDPVHFSALLEFAVQKEQEYQSAVHKY